jgi:hypothetical protein
MPSSNLSAVSDVAHVVLDELGLKDQLPWPHVRTWTPWIGDRRARLDVAGGVASQQHVVGDARIARIAFVVVDERLALFESEGRAHPGGGGLQTPDAIGELFRPERVRLTRAVPLQRVRFLAPLRTGDGPVRVELFRRAQTGDIRNLRRWSARAASGSRA